MLIADDQHRWVTGNAAACNLLGVPIQEVPWRALEQFTSARGRPRLEQQWPAFLSGGSAEGWYELDLPHRGVLAVEFSAIAHVLAGRHLVVFIDPDDASAFDPQAGAGREPAWAAVVGEGRERAALTSREREVITLLAAGGRSIDVGEKLFLSSETVKSHVHHAMVKLGARTRAHAVAIALVTGQITWAVEPVDDDPRAG
jgi:DNA-binding CsgD family transcriptional regulator